MTKQTSLCILLTLCLCSCVRLPQRGSEGRGVEIPERFVATDSLRVAYHYTEGMKVLTLEEELTKALPHFERVLEIDSLHAPTHYQMGEIFFRKDNKRALHHFEIAHKADTTNTEYIRMVGYTLLNLGEEQKPRKLFEQLIRLEPRNGENYRIVASLYAWSKMPHTAISILEEAESRIGYDPNLARFKRELLVREQLYDRAIEEALAAVANNPRDIETIVDLCNLYHKIGRPKEAKEFLHKALSLDPTNLSAQFLLMEIHEQEGAENEKLGVIKGLMLNNKLDGKSKARLYDEEVESRGLDYISKHFFAVNSLVEILHIKHPDIYEVALIYGRHKVRMGEKEEALGIFEDMIAKFPTNEEPYTWTYELEWSLGKHDEALHTLDKAMAAFPENEDYSLRKAYWLHNIGAPQSQVEGIIKQAIKSIADPQKRSSLYAALGDFQQNPDKKFRYYKKALQNDPTNSTALNNWAYFITIHGGELDRALEMSTRACEITPNNPTYIDTKAWILHLMGRVAEAKKLMRQAISLDTSGDSTLLLHYGDILAAEGERFMAEHYYKRALEAGEDAEIITKRIAELHRNKTE